MPFRILPFATSSLSSSGGGSLVIYLAGAQVPWSSRWRDDRDISSSVPPAGPTSTHRIFSFPTPSVISSTTSPRDTASRPSSGRATRLSDSRRPWPATSVPFDASIKLHLLSEHIGLFLLYLLIFYLFLPPQLYHMLILLSSHRRLGQQSAAVQRPTCLWGYHYTTLRGRSGYTTIFGGIHLPFRVELRPGLVDSTVEEQLCFWGVFFAVLGESSLRSRGGSSLHLRPTIEHVRPDSQRQRGGVLVQRGSF